jgi:hypothetical protein
MQSRQRAVQEATMTGGSKPKPGSKVHYTFQDGEKRSGTVGAPKHAGPQRPSKTPPKKTGGSLQPQRPGNR